MKKIYVLDTNILMHSPGVIFGFDDNDVKITDITIAELDRHKSDIGEIGYNVRHVVNAIKNLGSQGDYRKGISINSTGSFAIIPGKPIKEDGWRNDETPDNFIIGAALELKENSSEKVILITNDNLMRIKAQMLGLPVQEYKNEQIETDENYTGRSEYYTADRCISDLVKNKSLPKEDLIIYDHLTSESIKPCFIENEFVLLKSVTQNSSILSIYREKVFYIITEEDVKAYDVVPKNASQRFALKALLAPAQEIPLVILKGQAGTAKTFLSLAAGLQGVFDENEELTYNKILITRNNVLFDTEMGFLPGSEEDKMGPLVRGFNDNMEALLRLKSPSEKEVAMQIEDLMDNGLIKIESMAYMRGRSITNTYVIIDEAQNASVNQILGIITRAGMGTKIVICGDPNQIDNLKLDKKNNGLVFASEKMKGSSLCAQIQFTDNECVRSPLALEAANRLTINRATKK